MIFLKPRVARDTGRSACRQSSESYQGPAISSAARALNSLTPGPASAGSRCFWVESCQNH